MRITSGKLYKSIIKHYDNPEALTQHEENVVDLIVEEIALNEDEPGLIIWKRCRDYDVDKTKIARHLQRRGVVRKGKKERSVMWKKTK
jgi:chromosome condensin MukBEF complex kleisin-like MukF subunit